MRFLSTTNKNPNNPIGVQFGGRGIGANGRTNANDQQFDTREPDDRVRAHVQSEQETAAHSRAEQVFAERAGRICKLHEAERVMHTGDDPEIRGKYIKWNLS